MTRILAFDTSAAHCAAALRPGGGTVTTRVDAMTRGQAEHLMPMLEEMLAGAGFGWSDLEAIGVGTGPGNFTGIRIAVAAARGLALGLDIPAIGISTFAALADGAARPVTVDLPAPRGMIYRQAFTEDGPGPAELLEGTADPADPDRLVATIAAMASRRLATGETGPRPAPLYVRAADAAPPRDPAPVILP